MAETLGGFGATRVRRKEHILQDRKSRTDSRLSASDLNRAEQLVTGTWKEPAEPV